MWSKGAFKVHDSIIRYWVKYYEESSQFGIDEGCISKLMLKRGDEIIANYDRGWDIEPIDEDARSALALMMKKYN